MTMAETGKMTSRLESHAKASTIISKLTIRGTYFLFVISFIISVLLYYAQVGPAQPYARKLSVDFGNGQCVWEVTYPIGERITPFKTLISSYPGSNMRFTWRQSKGLMGIQIGDDFEMGGDGVTEKSVLVNTQYPHREGAWTWGNNIDQTILLVRNPRWAIPQYHMLLSKMHFAHDWETALLYLDRSFSMRPPDTQWIKWRDYHFDDEMKLWRWHIDFWMQGGKQYWIFDRIGQQPFFYLDDADKNSWPHDAHCTHPMDCHPKGVVSYEHLKNANTGPIELKKIAQLVRGKQGFTDEVRDGAIQCIWTEKEIPDKQNMDYLSSPNLEEFSFSITQLRKMVGNIQLVAKKYGSGEWVENPLAQNLVGYLNLYIDELVVELSVLNANPSPTPTPNANKDNKLAKLRSTSHRGSR